MTPIAISLTRGWNWAGIEGGLLSVESVTQTHPHFEESDTIPCPECDNEAVISGFIIGGNEESGPVLQSIEIDCPVCGTMDWWV